MGITELDIHNNQQQHRQHKEESHTPWERQLMCAGIPKDGSVEGVVYGADKRGRTMQTAGDTSSRSKWFRRCWSRGGILSYGFMVWFSSVLGTCCSSPSPSFNFAPRHPSTSPPKIAITSTPQDFQNLAPLNIDSRYREGISVEFKTWYQPPLG